MKTKKSLQDMARKKKQAAVSSEEEEESASGMSDESEEEEEEVEEEEVRSRKAQSVQRREEEDEEAWPSKENGGITVDDINLIRYVFQLLFSSNLYLLTLCSVNRFQYISLSIVPLQCSEFRDISWRNSQKSPTWSEPSKVVWCGS